MKCIVTAILLFASHVLVAQIPQSVQDDLTLQLDILSMDNNVNNASNANQIFGDYADIEVGHWIEFFDTYFTSHYLTFELSEFLIYSAFELPVMQVNTNLQISLTHSLFEKEIEMFSDNNSLGFNLSTNLAFRENLIYTNQFFNHFLQNYNPILPDNFTELLSQYETLIMNNESLLRKPNYFSMVDYPYLGIIRSQIYANLSGISHLNPIHTAAVEELIGLSDVNDTAQEVLFNDYGIVISDNGFLSENQTQRILDVVSSLPSDLIKTVNINVTQFVNQGSYKVESIAGFELFNMALGASTLEEFPNDADLFPVDLFTTRLVNAISQEIDNFSVTEQNHFLKQHKLDLIVDAGTPSSNYLRSMEPDGYFLSNPDLFFADIGSMYFSNTNLTFETALERALNGNTKAMDQFLLFANVLSAGENEIIFSTCNYLSPFTTTELHVEKNAQGYITHLYYNDFGCPHVFLLDENNRVSEVIPPALTYEIPNNGIDDDCDPTTFDLDADQDGVIVTYDCDDNDPNVNLNMTEVPYNGVDDDCNPMTLDNDLDQDGYTLEFDCDDNNAAINTNMVELPYNGIDDDCNPQTKDDDLDQDGYTLEFDCDDQNAAINSGNNEIAYNGMDDDCNPATLDDDLDQDGYTLGEECHDNNPDINPGAEEIPNNGIDEDCDGEDMIVSVENITRYSDIEVFPNPVSSALQFRNLPSTQSAVVVYDLSGRLIYQQILDGGSVDVTHISAGVYMLKILIDTQTVFTQKIIVE